MTTLSKHPSGSVKSDQIKLVVTDGEEIFNSDIAPPVTSTTTKLADVGDAINTAAAKVKGYMVLNITTGVTVFASGNADADVWHFYDETTAHSPI